MTGAVGVPADGISLAKWVAVLRVWAVGEPASGVYLIEGVWRSDSRGAGRDGVDLTEGVRRPNRGPTGVHAEETEDDADIK